MYHRCNEAASMLAMAAYPVHAPPQEHLPFASTKLNHAGQMYGFITNLNAIHQMISDLLQIRQGSQEMLTRAR